MTRHFELPTLPEPFPPAFVELLHELLAYGARPASRRDDRRRARRSQLGQSGTFVGHRRYAQGDDLRRLDWSAYARTGVLYVKQLAEDERRTATVLLDLSPRMFVGSPARRTMALRIAAVVGGLALKQLDGVQVIAPGGKAKAVAAFGGAADLGDLLRHLARLPVAQASSRDVMTLCEPRLGVGHVHWISDFARPDEASLVLGALRRRRLGVTGWLPSIAEDEQFAARGFVDIADPATGRSVAVPVDAGLAAAIQDELVLLRRHQERIFAECGARLYRWKTPAADELRRAAYDLVLAACAP